MSEYWKIYIKQFVVVHNHKAIKEVWRPKNKPQWDKYCDELAALQRKTIDEVSEHDRAMLHEYMYLLTYHDFLKYFSAECPNWSYVIHLVDSTIMNKSIDQRVSALESRMSTHPHTNSMAAGHNPGHNTHHNDAHILLHQLRNM